MVQKTRLQKGLLALWTEAETKVGLSNMHFKFWHSGNAKKLSPQVKALMSLRTNAFGAPMAESWKICQSWRVH